MSFSVSAGHSKTAEAAELILREGGNAVDAAIAAFLMSWVAEPCMSSAGGGGFALVQMAGTKPLLLDFFCQTPGKKRRLAESDFYPTTVDFGDTREVFHIGMGSTGVPGAVNGLFELYEQHGSLPLKELFQPAIQAAGEGVSVNSFQALDFQLLEPILAVDPKAQAVFFPEGRLIQRGEVLYMPKQADFLEYLWRAGKRAFYEGEIAQKIVVDYASGGGHLEASDFKQYQSIWRKPLVQDYKNYQIYTNPLPSLGGVRIGWFLEQLSRVTARPELRGAAHLQTLVSAFDFVRAQEKTVGTGLHGSTTHFSIIDHKGNAVSLTASNGEGCGYFIDGTDVQLNNMLGEAALLPAGFHSWEPNTRLSSLMAPTMIFKKEDLKLSLVTGSSGAGRIPYSIAQVIYYFLDFGLDIDQAVNEARMHWQENCWNLEPGFKFDPERLFAEAEYKVWKQSSLYFGGVNSVSFLNGITRAGVDRRREGAGVDID